MKLEWRFELQSQMFVYHVVKQNRVEVEIVITVKFKSEIGGKLI